MSSNRRRRYLRPPEDQAPRWPAHRDWPRIVVWAGSQILLFLALFQIYKLVRKTFITRAEGVAYDHALDILRYQGWMNSNFELGWQRWVLDRGDLILVFNNVYAYYMYGFYACAIVLLIMSPVRYRYLRRVFMISMIVALPWYALYPLAPPRFMDPYGWSFVDTLAVYGPNYFSESGLVTANRFAAMPSMHCGWTMVAGLMISAAVPWRWLGRSLFVFLTLLLAVTVIVTGNHYWLDIIGGWAVAGVSLLINRALPFPLPIQWPWQSTERHATAMKPSV
ncbi:MAG: phosphatase PAP2 family protein [Chloroflexota bacterium]|nr:phosphatase PAP2 family protein [Chloroflexota bacterium]